jgi:hypothetical protein
MRPPRRRRGKVHRIRIRRDIVIAKQRPPTQLEIRRQPPPPLEIPLQPQRIKSHPISRIRRLKNQISRLRIHRILKSPPQNPRQMRAGYHPPITQPHIKNPRPRSSPRHRVPAPSPDLHLMPTQFGSKLGLREAQTRRNDHKEENREGRKQKSPAQAICSHHALRGCPSRALFARLKPGGRAPEKCKKKGELRAAKLPPAWQGVRPSPRPSA